MFRSSYYLKESATIADGLPYGKGYCARANYRLSCSFAQLGDKQDSERYGKAAEAILCTIPTASEGLLDDSSDEERYNKLVPWMLW